jgi:hypothetical protein
MHQRRSYSRSRNAAQNTRMNVRYSPGIECLKSATPAPESLRESIVVTKSSRETGQETKVTDVSQSFAAQQGHLALHAEKCRSFFWLPHCHLQASPFYNIVFRTSSCPFRLKAEAFSVKDICLAVVELQRPRKSNPPAHPKSCTVSQRASLCYSRAQHSILDESQLGVREFWLAKDTISGCSTLDI